MADTLAENVRILQGLFADVDVLQLRFVQSSQGKTQNYCVAYCDGLINPDIINESLIKPLMLSPAGGSGHELIDNLTEQVIMVNKVETTDRYQRITEAITYGDTVLFAEGAGEAVIVDTKGFQTRAVSEPDNEKNLAGPREGFTESLLTNLSLVRRKVRSQDLKIKYRTLGRKTKTQAAVCYMDSIVNKQILRELYRRLDQIEIDGVLDTNYITELIRDSPYSPFRATGYTERPDNVVGKLLEGRIAVFLDGTPDVLTVPYLFIENFQSSEDYYLSFYYTSFSRILRILAFFITTTLPGFYVAMAGYHHEVLPIYFMLSVASERNSVPFPAAFEAFVMLLVFDILRETGVRMPSNIGQALSIVGALVLGQAAVAAKMVASPMIIVVAMTGITSLLIPRMNAPIIYIRFFLLLLSSVLGFPGTIMGTCIVLTHMLNLRSFGLPQISVGGKPEFQEMKDIAFRAPWWRMIMRPKILAADRVRMKRPGRGQG